MPVSITENTRELVLRRADNGGWVVVDPNLPHDEIKTLAAVSDDDGLMEWFGAQLCSPPPARRDTFSDIDVADRVVSKLEAVEQQLKPLFMRLTAIDTSDEMRGSVSSVHADLLRAIGEARTLTVPF